MKRIAWLLFFLPALGLGATLRGSVHNADGGPLSHVVVQVTRPDGTQIQTTETNAEGSFEWQSLRAGEYVLTAKSGALMSAATGPFTLRQNESKVVSLVLRTPSAFAFSNETSFTVAGVTDHTYVGGHGSDAALRSTEALVAATRSLSNAADGEKGTDALSTVHRLAEAAAADPSEANLYDYATDLLSHGAAASAASVFTQGVQRYGSSSRMLLGRAAALYADGQFAPAARDFFAATDLRPTDPEPYRMLADVHNPEITELPEYGERLARFVEQAPDDAWANYEYARYRCTHGGSGKEIRPLLEKAMRLNPHLGAAYLQLGILDETQADLPHAIENYRSAISVDPSMEEAHYRLAQAYRLIGNSAGAKAETDLFNQLSRASAARREKQRSELQQFVIALKSSNH